MKSKQHPDASHGEAAAAQPGRGRELVPRPPAVSSPSATTAQRRIAVLPNVNATRVANVLNSLEQWAAQHSAEAGMHAETLRLAEDLFQHVATSGRGTGLDDDRRMQVTRAAASCFLLERICAIFQRYHGVLAPVSEIILRSVFVPDTEEMRALLGTVHHPIDCDERYASLLAPYARKTYSMAHSEVSRLVTEHAKENRTIEIKLSRQSRIFDLTSKHWMTSVVRNYFLGWRQHCRRRHDMRQKHHYHFQRMRVEACKRRAIRMWRDRAAYVRRIAMLDATTCAELSTVTESTEKLQTEINALTDRQNQLANQIRLQEEERQELQAIVAEKESSYAQLQTKISEMDRVGSELLDTILMHDPPPRGANPLEVLVAWAHQLIAEAGGLGEEPLAPLLTEDFVVDVPWVAFAYVMSRVHSERIPKKAEVEIVLNNPGEAPGLLVQMYEKVTSSKSLVNAEQLRSRQRGLLLLFLAGLMRFASNWLVCRPPPPRQPPRESSSITHESSARFDSATPPEMPFAEGETSFMGFTAHRTWADKVKYQQQWITTSMSALHTALEISTHRPPILTADEQEDLILFLNVPMIRIVDVLPKSNPNGFFLSLMKSLQHVFSDLRKVYLAYAVPVLCYPDVVRLSKDCKLLDAKKLSKADIVALCQKVTSAVEPSAAPAVPADSPDSPLNASARTLRRSFSEFGLTHRREDDGSNDSSTKVIEPKHFTEVMLRLALLYNCRISKEPRDELTIPIATGFITESVAPHALRSDVDRFRQIVRHPQVRLQLAKYRPQLQKVFRRFAQQDDGHSLSRQQFFDLARECHWQSKTVTQEVLADIYKRCQVPDSATNQESMDFHECFEAIIAVALFSDPNPLVPAYQKLPPFIEDRILLPLQM